MTKRIYNIVSIVVSCILAGFVVHCVREYSVYGITTSLFYAGMAGVSIIAVLANLVRGGAVK